MRGRGQEAAPSCCLQLPPLEVPSPGPGCSRRCWGHPQRVLVEKQEQGKHGDALRGTSQASELTFSPRWPQACTNPRGRTPPTPSPALQRHGPCHRSPSFLAQDSTAAPTTPGERAKPQEEGGIASTHSGVLLFSDLKTLFLLLGQHPVWKAGSSRPSVLLSAVSCLTPRRSTPCLPKTLCKWNFGFINHRFLAAGCSRTGPCCSDKNVGLLPQTQTRGARRAAPSEHGSANCHSALCQPGEN